MAFRPVLNSAGPRGGAPDSDPREVIVVRAKPTAGGKSKEVIRIYLGVDLLREARYMIGDKLSVMVDTDGPNKVCLVARTKNGSNQASWKLTPTNGTGKIHGKGHNGTVMRGYITFTPETEEMPTFFSNGKTRYSAKNIGVRDEGILFDLE